MYTFSTSLALRRNCATQSPPIGLQSGPITRGLFAPFVQCPSTILSSSRMSFAYTVGSM